MAIEPSSPGAFPGAQRAASDDEALQRAGLALNARRPQDAERIAREILRVKSTHVRALQILGYALLAQDRGAEAIAPLETAARNTHDPEVDTALAAALRQSGRFDEAVSRLK